MPRLIAHSSAALSAPVCPPEMILDNILYHPVKRRHRAVDLFNRVINVRAQANASGRRSPDAVFSVQSFINLLGIVPVKTDHAYSGANLRFGGSAEPCAGNIADAFFQGRGQLADARLDPLASDQVMKVHGGSHRRHGGVIALAKRLEFARPARRGFYLVTPSDADHARPDLGDSLLPDV